ncbi:MAG: hypothetical protein EHM35_07825 [Planctomycetaceae bacterium]|nr:MAG: hypothetical protein EHM35_07825 [Planctomycetaceae bacterium]
MIERADRVSAAYAKIVAPFTLDETLTFFCPQENVEALEHPAVRELHRFMLTEYQPPVTGKKAVMLLLPCTKVKPYSLSEEHQAINRYLLSVGFRPCEPGDHPPELLAALAQGADGRVLNNGVWERGDLLLHRFVISEPMALVPYELIYRFGGKPSPVARYDDPGLFEHRGTAVCPWRPDCTGKQAAQGYRWGDNEKAAFVEMHNRLVELIVAMLERFGDAYVARLAFVSPKLTHRSFLTSAEEKRRAGLALGRRTGQGLQPLRGVNDSLAGWVRCIPDEAEIEAILGRLAERSPGRTPRQIKGTFASGGAGVTPLVLPETLDVLGRHLDSL